jgi:hypothetical protein
VKTNGTLACWGDNSYGQSTPPAGTFTQVAAGASHTCGVKTDGTLACWGYNGSGQSTPPAGTFTQVAAGAQHTCGVKTDGTLACWGRNDYGQVYTDSDGDLVTDSLDNCPYEPNPTQADSGGINTAVPDGIGDACQCGDTNNDGKVTATDATVLKRALLGLSPYFSVAALPGLNKCNVGTTVVPGVAGCTTSDATVISRAILSLSPGIAQTCDAAAP